MRRLLLPLALLVAAPAAADERNYMLTSFDTVRVEGPFEVEIVTGGSARAAATGVARALDQVSVRVNGTTLVVAPAQNAWGGYPGASPAAPAKLRVTAPAIRSVVLNGGGKLRVSRMGGPRVLLVLTGAGTIDVAAVDAERLDVTLTGTGAVTLAGRARTARFQSDGAGAIDAGALTADALVANVQSSGDSRFAARDTANVAAFGTGLVEVAGKAVCTSRGTAPVRCGERAPPRQ